MTSDEIIQAWQSRSRVVDAPGAESRWWAEGAGPDVLCLHGVPASAFLYRKVLPELAARGCRGLAVDLPGLGLAERPEAFDYRWSGLAAWLAGAVDAMKLDRFHLVVHDIGGPIGFDLVRRMPERILSVTVLNCPVRTASFRKPPVMRPFGWPVVGALYLATLTPWTFERLMRIQGVSSPVPAAELRAYALLLKREDGGRAYLRIMRGFETTPSFEEGILEALRARKFPLQIVWGRDDPALRLDRHGELAREALGVDTIHTVAGRHFFQEDSPAEIAEHVARIARSS